MPDFYASLIENSPYGYAYHRIILNDKGIPVDYEFLEVNEAFLKTTGFSRDEVIGRTVLQLLPDIIRDPFDWIACYGQVALNGLKKTITQYSVPLDRWFRIEVYSPQKGNFVAIFIDISEEVKKEEELHNFFEVTPDLFCILNERFEVMKSNNTWLSLLGYSEKDVNGSSYLNFIHSDDRGQVCSVLENLTANKTITHRLLIKDSGCIFVELHLRRNGHCIYAAARDVSKRVEAERLLREKNEQFSLAVLGSSEGLWDWNILTGQAYLSSQWKLQLGFQDDEIPNSAQSFFGRIHPEDKEKVKLMLNRYLDKEVDDYSLNIRLKHKNGSYRWVRTKGKALWDEHGTAYRMAGSQSDITDQVSAEEKLVSTLENFTNFFESMNDMVFITSYDGVFRYVNQATVNRLGYTLPEMNRITPYGLVPLKYHVDVRGFAHGVRCAGRINAQIPMQTKSGSIIYAEFSVWSGRWNDQECIFAVVKDITALQTALERFQKIFYSNPSLMALSSLPDRKLVDVNPSFLKHLKYERKDVIGKTPAELNLFPDTVAYQNAAWELRENGSIFSREIQVKTKEGNILNGLFSGEILESDAGRFALTVMMDMTEQKEAEARLEETINELRNALDEIKTLKEMLPICSSCKKIRDDDGYWQHVERYISLHSEISFSHGLCPDCLHTLYPDFVDSDD